MQSAITEPKHWLICLQILTRFVAFMLYVLNIFFWSLHFLTNSFKAKSRNIIGLHMVKMIQGNFGGNATNLGLTSANWCKMAERL